MEQKKLNQNDMFCHISDKSGFCGSYCMIQFEYGTHSPGEKKQFNFRKICNFFNMLKSKMKF